MEHLAIFFAHLVSFMIPEVVESWGADFLHQELNKPIEHSRLLQLAEGLYRQGFQQDGLRFALANLFFFPETALRPDRKAAYRCFVFLLCATSSMV